MKDTNKNPTDLINKVNSLSIEESRGFTIEKLYEIELILDKLFLEYFDPKNYSEFKNVLLNGNILDLGKKIKILNGLEIINNKLADKLRRISSIRNSCAHAGIEIIHEMDLFPNQKEKTKLEFKNPRKRLKVMKSNGKIEEKFLTELIIEFAQLYLDLKSELFLVKIK